MKLYDKKEILPIVLILIVAAIGFYLYPQLPDLVPSHWGINGEINGWMSSAFAVYFFPGLILFLYLLLSFVPLMDPLKANIEMFSHSYFWFKVVLVLFLSLLYLITLYTGLGYDVNVQLFVMIGIAVLFAMIGYIMPQIKKNYTIGIRLPWTLHSEAVWTKTHKFGGRLFIVFAVVAAVASFLPSAWAFGILIAGIFLLLAVLVAYSYMEYRKIKA
ncbi:MAG: SdpI family protein [Candidatus Portnoybacteria bacterium]|nr:SdpI family protein [Candidatus Portnoybacteria bacterium]MDD4982356.1 SdpI family protein [Candidatus Portnoybacteria bacterium]